jgi:hypothetical protein
VPSFAWISFLPQYRISQRTDRPGHVDRERGGVQTGDSADQAFALRVVQMRQPLAQPGDRSAFVIVFGEAEGGAQVELRARSVSGDIRITRAAPTAG